MLINCRGELIKDKCDLRVTFEGDVGTVVEDSGVCMIIAQAKTSKTINLKVENLSKESSVEVIEAKPLNDIITVVISPQTQKIPPSRKFYY